ncbi:MAG: cytochrome c [Alphaproteobacteria bacterium]|jgi:mono/diheme cytochrome c family protein|nr:MAG: cytochrome c [Alphaproteobacteria bacterium]
MQPAFLILVSAGLNILAGVPAAMAQPATTAPSQSGLDVKVLFASNCGFCHGDGGRAAGKGPQLMETKRTDEFLRDRIKNGKEGAMPAFGQMFSDPDIDAIINYIHELKPEGQG